MFILFINSTLYFSIKRILVLLFITISASTFVFSQTDLKVGTTPGSITPSAVFEASSTTKGVLIPRMTTVQMNTIASPVNGLMIFNTDRGCMHIYNGSAWRNMCTAVSDSAWTLTGNSGTTAGTNFLGTTDAQDLVFKANNTEGMRIKDGGNVGIGSNNPNRKLVVEQAGDGVAFVSSASLNLNRFESTTNSSSVGLHLKTKNASAATQEIVIGVNPTYYSGTGVFTITDGLGAQYFNIDLLNRHIIANEFGGNFGIGTIPSYKLDVVGSNPLRLIGLNAGATTDSLLTSSSGVVRRMGFNQFINGNAWSLTGNSGTTAGTNFIGTTDAQSFVIKTNNSTSLTMPVNPRGGLVYWGNNRSAWSYLSSIGFDNWAPFSSLGNIDTSFSVIGSIGLNDLFAIYGKVPTNRVDTDGELHIASGDDGNEPIIFEHYNSAGTVFTERMRIHSNGYIGINAATPQYRLDIDAQTGSSGNPLRLLGLNAGATTDSLLTSASGVVRRMSFNQFVNGNAWSLTGNSGTTAGTNFIGTTDAQSLVFKANNTEGMRLNTSGYLGIGTINPSVQLDVVGRANILTASDFNLFINAGNTTTTGTYNTGIGLSSFGNLTSGSYNTAFVGLGANTTGSYNTAFGGLATNSTGSSNAAFGSGSLLANTTGTHNAAFGTSALEGSIDGNHNTAIGNYALSGVTNGSSNIGLGWGAGDNLTTGSDNIMIGFQIKAPSTTGSGQLNIGNLLYGTSLGTGTTLSTGNIGINITAPQYKLDIDAQTGSSGNPLRLLGLNAGATTDSILTSASGVVRRMSINNLAWGLTGNSGTVDGTNFLGTTDNIPLSFRVNNQRAGRIDPILDNTFLGYQAGNVTTGNNNTFIGDQSGLNNSTGSDNTAIGSSALNTNTTGINNVAVGQDAMRLTTTGSANAAVGESALESNTIGAQNVAMGNEALQQNTTSSDNLALGYRALYNHAFSNGGTAWSTDNIALGTTALYNNQPTTNTNGYRNIGLGRDALYNNTIGSANVALGYQAGNTITSGSNNTVIGYDADVSSATLTNATAIGANAVVGASNSLVLGGTGSNAVNVGIGVSVPEYKLHLEEPGGYNGDIGIRLYNTNNSTFLPSLILQAARGTKSTPSAVTTGTILGAVRNGGYDGSAFTDIEAAEMRANASENWTTSAHGTSLSFGTIQNGTTSLVDRMIISDNGNVGVNTTSPSSSLETAGSMGANITTTSAASITLDGSHYTLIINTGATTTVTLPAANTCARRIYVIVNRTAGARTISTYQTFAAGTSTTIAAGSAMTLQSDGSNWYRIQ